MTQSAIYNLSPVIAPAFSVHKNGTAQSISDSTPTALTWSTEVYDTNNDFASNKFTPKIAGRYSLKAAVFFQACGTEVWIEIGKNGTGTWRGSGSNVVSTGNHHVVAAADIEADGSGDYYEIYAYHRTGSAKNVHGGSVYTYFQGHLITPVWAEAGGAHKNQIRSVSAAYTVTEGDYTILADASGAAFTVTLPAASGMYGRVLVIKKTDSSANAVTIDGNASETVDGSTTKSITTQYASYTVHSDGSNWFIL